MAATMSVPEMELRKLRPMGLSCKAVSAEQRSWKRIYMLRA